MKVSIQNLLGLKRSFSKPNGISVSINGYEQLHLVDQDKFEKFYLGYRNHNYKVLTQLEEFVEEVSDIVNDELTNEEEQPKEQLIDEKLVDNKVASGQEQNVIDKVEKQVEVINDEELKQLLNELSVEQLKLITDKLNVVTSSTKASTIINKIFDATEDNQVILDAINSIKGDA